MKLLALTSCLLARIALILMSSFALPVVFKKSIFRNLTYLCTYINLELPSSSLYALRELLEKSAALCENNRSSCLEVFCKQHVLRNFAKYTGKHLCQGLFFTKVAALWPATLSKKNLWHRCFPVNF